MAGITEAQEVYHQTFQDVLTSRGLDIEKLRKKGQEVQLVADIDEEDGGITLGHYLDNEIKKSLSDIPIFVESVALLEDIAFVKVTTNDVLANAIDENGDETDFLRHQNHVYDPSIFFNFRNGLYFVRKEELVGAVPLGRDGKLWQVTDWQDHDITPDVIGDFSLLVTALNQRPSLRIIVSAMDSTILE